jgi:hypothetical protein
MCDIRPTANTPNPAATKQPSNITGAKIRMNAAMTNQEALSDQKKVFPCLQPVSQIPAASLPP